MRARFNRTGLILVVLLLLSLVSPICAQTGLEIFEAKDLREADEIARRSPLVERGLVTWMLREWTETTPRRPR